MAAVRVPRHWNEAIEIAHGHSASRWATPPTSVIPSIESYRSHTKTVCSNRRRGC